MVMKRLFSVFLLGIFLFVAGCGEPAQEKPYESYHVLIQTYLDAHFGHQMPSKEAVKDMRHRFMQDDFEASYQELLEERAINIQTLKKHFGEDYTFTYELVSETTDRKAQDRVEQFLRNNGSYEVLSGYGTLKLEVTFRGNGKTYVMQGFLEVFCSDLTWYLTDTRFEAISNIDVEFG